MLSLTDPDVGGITAVSLDPDVGSITAVSLDPEVGGITGLSRSQDGHNNLIYVQYNIRWLVSQSHLISSILD